AYPTAVAHAFIPKRPLRHFDSLPTDSVILRSHTRGIIAECTVTTDTPIVPCRMAGEVWWPIGTFRTILAQPEIVLALEAGAGVKVGSGWTYELGAGLRPWANWCLLAQHDTRGGDQNPARGLAPQQTRPATG